MMRSVVVLPAPFGPSRPKIDPRRTVKLKSSTARIVRPRVENVFARFCTTMADVDTDDLSFDLVGHWSSEQANGARARRPCGQGRRTDAAGFSGGTVSRQPSIAPTLPQIGPQAGARCRATIRCESPNSCQR